MTMEIFALETFGSNLGNYERAGQSLVSVHFETPGREDMFMAIMDDAMIIQRLMTLRVELFTAAQVLRGEPLKEFWKLIDDINAIRPPEDEKNT